MDLWKDPCGQQIIEALSSTLLSLICLGSIMLMIIQGYRFRCLYKKQINYLLLQEGLLLVLHI